MKAVLDALAADTRIHAWTAERSRTTEHQRYLLSDRPESERIVTRDTTSVTVFERDESGQGAASFTLSGSPPVPDGEALENAMFRARLERNPPYTLPERSPYADVRLADSTLAEDADRALDSAQEALFEAVAKESGVRLAAGELFATDTETTLHTSTGAAGAFRSTSLFVEFVLLARRGDDEQESVASYSVRRAADLDVPALVRRHATRARDSLLGTLPMSGTRTVVLSEASFLPLFRPFRYATSGNAVYRKHSPVAVGQPLFGERVIRGDRLTMVNDPTLPYGGASAPFDGDGLRLDRHTIVDAGQVVGIATSKRYADYLNIRATGNWRNTVVTPGSISLEEALTPDGAPLLHVVEFSWLNPSAVRGSFSTEIRLGYEIDAGGVRVVRGGSLAGNVYDAFAHAAFTSDTVLENRYDGPSAIRLEELVVAGE